MHRVSKIALNFLLMTAGVKAANLLIENAEDPSPAITAVADVNYSVVQSDVAPEGKKAFFLTHTSSDQSDQILTLNKTFIASAGTNLYFESRISWATPSQIAYVEVKEIGTNSWNSIWAKAGTDSSNSSFEFIKVPLSRFSGKKLSIRFRYASFGNYYPSDSIQVGWVFDNVSITDSYPTREWSIGEPSATEQLVIELINRARADSQADLHRLMNTKDEDVLSAYQSWDVQLDVLKSQFSGNDFGPEAIASGENTPIPKKLPPLAPNPKLTSAARLHSEDMFKNEFQDHVSSSHAPLPNEEGDKPGDRIKKQHYHYKRCSENVFAWGDSPWHIHAGFTVDWGFSNRTGLSYEGMQDPAGHRYNIYEQGFREVGIGIFEGTKTSTDGEIKEWGPLVTTQNFGTSKNYDQPFVTGVVYFDLDGDQFYDEGEGIGGVTLTIEGSPYHSVTPDSGGYAIPLDSNGIYTLRFTLPNGSFGYKSVTIANLENVKSDITPRLPTTTPFGPEVFETNTNVYYYLEENPTATAYRMYSWEIVHASGSIGAEISNEIIANTSKSYNNRQGTIVKTGSFAYRLVSPDAKNQTIELGYDFLPRTSATMHWQDFLGTISRKQHVEVQVSRDTGRSWITLDTREGSDQNNITNSFFPRSLSLDRFVGEPIKIRFRIYNPSSTSYIESTSDTYGWYIDDITFSKVDVLINKTTTEQKKPEWTIRKQVEGIFFLKGEAVNRENYYHSGPGLRINAVNAATATRETALVGTHLVKNWYRSTWMDYYFASSSTGSNWFYHYTLGWLYFGGISRSGGWYYEPTLGWLWTTSSDYPMLYQSSANKWLIYEKDSTNPRYFYDTSTKTWSVY